MQRETTRAKVLGKSKLQANNVPNRKSIPKVVSGRKTLRNVTRQISNSISISLPIKIFPIWCNINFEDVFFD